MTKATRIEQLKDNFEYDRVGKNHKGTSLDQVETAAYISDIVLQLRNMAKAADLKFLVYFLEMAFQEAFSQSARDDNKDAGKPES